MRALVSTTVVLICLVAAAFIGLSARSGLEGEPHVTLKIDPPSAGTTGQAPQARKPVASKQTGKLSETEATAAGAAESVPAPEPAVVPGLAVSGEDGGAQIPASEEEAASGAADEPAEGEGAGGTAN